MKARRVTYHVVYGGGASCLCWQAAGVCFKLAMYILGASSWRGSNGDDDACVAEVWQLNTIMLS
jgi:hypothetical protein